MTDSSNNNTEQTQADVPSKHKYNIPNLKQMRNAKAPLESSSSVKKVIGVVSGKGGVGKSLVTTLLASKASHAGLKTAVLDSDITGPSIPRAFGINEHVGKLVDDNMLPLQSKSGIKVMSINLLLQNDTDPVIWRGPVIAGAVKQFWSEVVWGDIDVMFVDMPPGTGDVALTVFQSLPIDGIVIVTSPQELVGMIVGKAVNMAKNMNIPVLGIVENMSFIECPDCGRHIELFGPSHLDEVADQYKISNKASIPMDPKLTKAVDTGNIESFEQCWLDDFYQKLVVE